MAILRTSEGLIQLDICPLCGYLVSWVDMRYENEEAVACRFCRQGIIVGIPREVLDLRKDRRGRPRCKSCILCGDKGYAAPVIEGEKVPLCKRHYNTWYKRRQRARERSLYGES